MFFRSNHPEDKRIFSVLLLVTVIVAGLVGYALWQLRAITPAQPTTSSSLEGARGTLESQLESISQDTLGESLESIEEFLVTEELKAKIEDVTADSVVTTTPQE